MLSSMKTEVEEDIENGKQLELVEHLAELRTRIIRCAIYLAIGACAGWFFFPFFFKILAGPIIGFLKEMGSSFLLTGVAEGFTIKFQISLITGLILALPLITMEGWGFIAPGLTRKERLAVKLVAPLSILLFCLGVALAYFALPMGIRWLISQNPPGAKFMPSVAQTLLFIIKMYLAFGLVFQTPIILMFLARVGIVDSQMLKSYWRQAVLALLIVAAAVTPSGDAMTMMMIGLPMVFLYILSIGLVKLVEPRS